MKPEYNCESLADASKSRISPLSALLRHARATLRYVDYKQAEYDCEQLAANILQIYSEQELRAFSFIAIPRGGFIILGMLSYILNLRADQMHIDPATSKPLFIVDDCALTGGRFSSMLKKTKSPQVVFAHLYSHPELRQTILDREPRVKHCITAHDLVDHAKEQFTSLTKYQSWQKLWRKRLGTERYWYGQSDLICFAWNEPDHPFWNAETEQVEDGWRFVPPHRCLKNKSGLGVPPATIHPTELQLASSVVVGCFDGVLWLVHTESEQVYSLQDPGADMLRAIAVYGDQDMAAKYLLNQYEIDAASLHRDLSTLIADLLAKGLLVRVADLNDK